MVYHGRLLTTRADRKVVQQQLIHLGYKTHVSQDAKTGIVTSIKPTTGSSADNKQVAGLIDNDRRLGLTPDTYTADRGYDDGELHTKLQSEGMHSALMLNKTRTEKRDSNEGPWLALLDDDYHKAGVKVRYRIERTFGEAKLWHRLGLARYRGLLNFKIQSYMTFMAINPKRIVWLLTGTRPRTA